MRDPSLLISNRLWGDAENFFDDGEGFDGNTIPNAGVPAAVHAGAESG